MPQAPLTDHEMSRLPIGNQHTDSLTLIEWQCVKGAAMEAEVSDWTSKVDSSLSYGENITLMYKKGTSPDHGPTMRELKFAMR
jgi:hypothetical protein